MRWLNSVYGTLERKGQSISLSYTYAELTLLCQGQRTHTLTIAGPPASGTLGLSLQLAPLNSTQNIWHILTIPSPLSPAHLAGLLPHSDYILGTPSGTLRTESALGELVEDHLNRSLVLWVYNSEFDVVREVELVPRRGWGGEGALGAVLGFGALHRLPVGLGEEVQAPGEKLFESERKSTDYYSSTNGDKGQVIVPAEMGHQVQPAPTIIPSVAHPRMMSPDTLSRSAGLQPATAPRLGRKGRHHANVSPNRGFDDIFAEGAKKSLEEDYVPSLKNKPLPPPPKAGAPVAPSPPPAVVDPMPRPASGEQPATEAI